MRATTLAVLITLAGCATLQPAVAPGVKPRPETAGECVGRCGELGMRLGAVVLIRNSAGCVCEPAAGAPSSTSTPVTGGAAAVVGGVVALDDEAAAEQRRQEQQRRSTVRPMSNPRP